MVHSDLRVKKVKKLKIKIPIYYAPNWPEGVKNKNYTVSISNIAV